jgi:FRG domain
MRKIHGDVFTYADFPESEELLKEGTKRSSFGVRGKKGGPTWATVQNVREWPGFTVRRFEDLVKISAHLAAGNRGHMLFFRGQKSDHVDRNGRTNLYPTLFRKGRSPLKKTELADRWQRLETAVAAIVRERNALGLPGKTHRHIEAAIALLQHYGLCETPLLDVSPSLRVAASFALPSKKAELGYLYAIALPYPHGTISHFVDQDTVLVRLLGVCPFEAVRPHFQEGYLVGKYPIANAGARGVVKEKSDNAASRLVAKLILDDRDGGFFGRGFPRVPASTLLPPKDPFGDKLRKIVLRALDSEKSTPAPRR